VLARLLAEPADELGDLHRADVAQPHVGGEVRQCVPLEQPPVLVARLLAVAAPAGADVPLDDLAGIVVQQRLGALSRLRVALAIGALVARLVSVQAGGVSLKELRLALRDSLPLACLSIVPNVRALPSYTTT
jgi:hypothetical protein